MADWGENFFDWIFGYEEIKIEDKYAYLKDAENVSPAEYYNAYLYNYIINAKLELNERIGRLSNEIGYWRACAVSKFEDVPNVEYMDLFVPDVPKGAYDLDSLFSNLIEKYYNDDYDELYYQILQKHALSRLSKITYKNKNEFDRLVKKEMEIEFAISRYESHYYSDD